MFLSQFAELNAQYVSTKVNSLKYYVNACTIDTVYILAELKRVPALFVKVI